MLDVTPWSDVQLVERVTEGNRTEVWLATNGAERLSVRRSRRSSASLAWELELLSFLDRRGFLVPVVVPTDRGWGHHGGVVVQRWIEGRSPRTDDDWSAVAGELQRLHAETTGYSQRPDCCIVTELHRVRRSVDADLDALPSPLVD